MDELTKIGIAIILVSWAWFYYMMEANRLRRPRYETKYELVYPNDLGSFASSYSDGRPIRSPRIVKRTYKIE